MRKIIIISDIHGGNLWGLTPPGYLSDDSSVRKIQQTFWEWYCGQIKRYGPFDALIGVGDFTDGEGKKGTLDLAYTDVRKQAEIAEGCLTETGVDPSRMYLVRGSPFHSNGVCEYEDKIADDLGCSIKDVQKLDIEGWKIHTRHVVGRSDIPYGQGTPLLKELARMEHEALRDSKDAPDIILRGHVHYSFFCGKHGRLAIDCPCLELPLSSANGRRYSAWEYDVGFGILSLDKDREPVYQPIIMNISLVHSGKYETIQWEEV